jgi:type I restriction enzyme R subunit|tara:strand:- start:102 stop:380 length:279 start_codon:yes stop_codon:yes gene_type:complete
VDTSKLASFPLASSYRYDSLAIREAFADHKQLEFIDFILEKYVQDGVKELEIQNIKSLATLKYHSVTDAATVLGSASVIKETFVGFQKYLYI